MSGTQPVKTWTRDNWPIAAAMIQYPNSLPGGGSVQDQSAEGWASTLEDIVDAGFTDLDPTDSWLRLADLSKSRLDEFMGVVSSLGLTIPAISTSRRSVIDPDQGDAYLDYSHRVIDTAAGIGAKAVSFGLFGPLSPAQKQVLWFWTKPGVTNPDDPATWQKAVSRIRELGRHAAEVGLEVSLEMYEDTYLGTADSAVRFVTEVDCPAVGLNLDLGNLIRLHRPIEHWQTMLEKTVPFAKYWHVKNYMRDEDPDSGSIVTMPTPMESGLISYRVAIKMAIAAGFNSAFLVEHYGGDGLSICARNRDYLRSILPKARLGLTP
ncbi:sugar phosphate isomerase/epimerase [Acidisoma cellulosilytica]|uniref:Sugar phosphate isomerase/epimerase n=1 Tax=Acidisoma cellulosilyticum TaxID=2802395 RepID=A0A964E589_9PROT|nr:sugar phosphate isomerase/epimerase family protein [Acidisoma cellulosilyticum]MCB8882254.1 sugar phosphate isomerase/epimerase [Acidisoma cellulosilyticum]